MPAVRPITLSTSDRERPCVFLHRGQANAHTFTRARILLKLGAGWSGAQIAAACDVSPATVTNVRTRFLRGGLDAVLSDKRQERRRQALTGAQQALLIALACSDVPAGIERQLGDSWSGSERAPSISALKPHGCCPPNWHDSRIDVPT